MKTCPNCRVIHPDDYNGTCPECGAPLGGVQPNGATGADMQARYNSQIAMQRREGQLEAQMKRGNYSNVPLEQSMVDVARRFVVVDEEKLEKLGGDPSALR
jgi:hypothetical protein